MSVAFPNRLNNWLPASGRQPPICDMSGEVVNKSVPGLKPDALLATLFSDALLRKMVPAAPKNADVFVPHLNKAMQKYGITSRKEKAAFLANLAHESGGFKYVKELWGPTPEQKRYERDFKQPWNKDDPRNGKAFELGNDTEGDGSKFRGRGLIQTTGKRNYQRVSRALFGDDRLLKNPELLEVPEYAALSAVWFWADKKLGQYCTEDWVKANPKENWFKKVVKGINGGYNGLEERQHYYDIAFSVLAEAA